MKKGESKLDYAPFWKRVLAYIIDSTILGLIILLPLKSSSSSKFRAIYDAMDLQAEFSFKVVIIGFISALIVILYFALLEYNLQQTIGKIILRIKVISKTKTLTFWQCFVRNLMKFSSPLLFLDTLYILFKRTHQRFFDKIANTEVVEIPKDGKR